MVTSHHPSSFAKGLNFYKLFWLFFVASFLGVVIETIWCMITRGVIESRTGLILGPFNLVYGLGALCMTAGLYPLREKPDRIILAGGFVIGSIFEYICSYFQEQCFGTISWDYSNFWFNLNGRVNLLYSLFWGLLAIAWIRYIFPKASILIEKIPNHIGIPLTWILVFFMVFNTSASAMALYRQSERRLEIPPSNRIKAFFDDYYPDEVMEKIYPNMVYIE
ncbi:hypothetical protein GMB51_10390 [Turicibacter sanguinis]|nr:hypothetical protein [Turicibacter sanguinis]MTN51227.1 hypothetical protein [Turicibacter sanguinis]MTN54377.1 hypothetical protein [Turicibacter sanguinis]MTN57510.1 hypothetical protein [Turicibacter sanguinis]MTN60575.1 hypothetical protein [Turicibacter sanguinis]